MISMLRGCKPRERTSLLGSASFSSTSTSTSWSRSSLASIIPVGPPPLMITSDTKIPDSANTYFGGQSQIARSRKAARRLRDQAAAYHPAAEWGSCGNPPDGRYHGTSKENNLLAFLMCGPRHFLPGRDRDVPSIRSECHSILALSSWYGDGWCRVRDRGDRRWGESGGGAVPFPGG